MRYFRTKRSGWPAFLALFALYVQVLLPLGQALSLGTDENGFPSRMIICTFYGVELVELTTGKKVTIDQADDKVCPVCDDLAIGASTLINYFVPTIENVRPRVIATLTPTRTFQVVRQSFKRNRNPRAPPTFA